ncbi:hypothetical protein KW95_03465 [Clostridioides difficile]|nr:hypothetical protein KW95_03465 [Clostridioides difficile]
MIILIAGASHTGKTLFAQKILEKYKYTYLSIDLLKMGLIRSGNTKLTPEDDEELVPYLWSIIKEIIKTAIENRLDDSFCTMESTIEENTKNLQMCKKYDCNYILIEDEYTVDISF